MGAGRSKEPDLAAIQQGLQDVRVHQEEVDYLARVTYFDTKTINTLYDLFCRISAYNVSDDHIDHEEFAKALGIKSTSILNKRLFDRFNVTKSDAMNFREFCMALSTLSTKAEPHEKIRFSFDLYDLNRDNTIDLPELKEFLLSALENAADHLQLTPQQIDEICENTLKQSDSNGNGRIEFREYEQMVVRNPRLLAGFTIDIDEMLHSARRKNLLSESKHQRNPSTVSEQSEDSDEEQGIKGSVQIIEDSKISKAKSKHFKKSKSSGSASHGILSGCSGVRHKTIKAEVVSDIDSMI